MLLGVMYCTQHCVLYRLDVAWCAVLYWTLYWLGWMWLGVLYSTLYCICWVVSVCTVNDTVYCISWMWQGGLYCIEHCVCTVLVRCGWMYCTVLNTVLYRLDVAGCNILHVLQHRLLDDFGGSVLRVCSSQVYISAHHDYVWDGYVLVSGKYRGISWFIGLSIIPSAHNTSFLCVHCSSPTSSCVS